MSGFVRDDEGEAISGLVVRADQGPVQYSTRSAEDGAYSVSLAAGEWRIGAPYPYLEAAQRGYFDMTYPISVGESGLTTNIVLPKLRSALIGTVRKVSGEPLQQQITLRATINGQQVVTFAQSDTNGSFRIGLPNGIWSAQPEPSAVDQAGFVPVAAQTITLVNETNATEFVLSPATNIIRGRVIDDAGAPIANLPMYWYSGGNSWRNVTTDADGNYSFVTYPDRWEFYFYGLAERRLAASFFSTRLVEVVEGAGVTTCNARLFRTPYDIHVRFVDENGDLYTSTTTSLLVQSKLDGEPIQLSAQAVEGKADIAVAAGSWTIFGPAPYNQIANVVSDSVDVTFVVHPTNSQSRFFGKVVDEQGAGIPNFQIQATWDGPIDTTADDGSFEFLLPTGSLYPRAADTNYVMAATAAAPAPNYPVERIITARRATRAMLVKLNFPEGSQPDSMSVSSSTRVGGSAYYVNASNGTNSFIRLAVFPGSWKVGAYAAGFGDATPKVVEVGSDDVEITFDFQKSQVSSRLVRGKVVFPSGSALKYGNIHTEADSQWDYGQTDEEGRFSLRAGDGQCKIVIIQWPTSLIIPVQVNSEADIDVGLIEMPNPKAKAVITFVDETGIPIRFSGYYQNSIRATRDMGAEKIEVTDEGMENGRSALLTPGTWKIEGETRDEGFAIAAPIMLEVGESDVRTNIVLRRLETTRTAPALTISSRVEGLALRTTSGAAKYVDIEASADLKVWRYYSTQSMIESQVDLAILTSGDGPNLYFRAASADLPAAE